MRNPGGYGIWTGGNGPDVERDTFTCAHCNDVKFVEPGHEPTDLGGLCKVCMGLICAPCVMRGNCDPFEKKLERSEARGRFLRSLFNG